MQGPNVIVFRGHTFLLMASLWLVRAACWLLKASGVRGTFCLHVDTPKMVQWNWFGVCHVLFMPMRVKWTRA